MSGETGERRDWRFYVNDMIEFAEKVLSYTSGVDRATFVANTLTYDATLRNLELIGEAATHIPERFVKNTRRFPGARSLEHAIAWLMVTLRSRLSQMLQEESQTQRPFCLYTSVKGKTHVYCHSCRCR